MVPTFLNKSHPHFTTSFQMLWTFICFFICADMTLTVAMTVGQKILQTLCPLSPSSQWAWARSTCLLLPMPTMERLTTGTSLMVTAPPRRLASPILFLLGWVCVWTLRRAVSPFMMLILSAHSGKVQSTALLLSVQRSASLEEGLCSSRSWCPTAMQIKRPSEESPSSPVSLNWAEAVISLTPGYLSKCCFYI